MGLYKPGSRLLNHDFCLVKKSKTGPIIYGFAVDETNSDPYSSVTYIEDCAGFTPATNVNGVFDGGSWLDVFPFNQIKPCHLDANGNIISYLNPNNFKQNEDGSQGSGFYRVVSEIPPIYWKFTKTDTGYEVRWSNVKVDDSYQALAHSRGDVVKGNLYVGVYEGNYSDSDSALCSRTGYAPTVSNNLSTFRTQASGWGNSGYGLMNFHTLTLLQILFVSMFKSLDSQSVLGQGITDASAMSNTGTMDTAGMYYGDPSDATVGVKFMGIENLWGNTNTWIDGLIRSGNNMLISDNTIFNDTGEGYAYSYSSFNDENIGGYMGSVQGTQVGAFLPNYGYGTSSTFYCDYGLQPEDGGIIRHGGSYTNGSECGIFLYYRDNVTATHAKTGARLQYLAP